MIEILLGGRIAAGRVTLVDDMDAWALDFGWSVNGHGYAQRAGRLSRGERKGWPVLLHRELLGYPADLVDHRNRDRLDNRRDNLRVVSRLENHQNVSAQCGTSQYRGVYLHECGRWAATASQGGKSIYLGLHLTEQDAAEASATWRRQHMAGALD